MICQTLAFAAATRARQGMQINDDRWFAEPATGCFVIADGVGRSSAGGLAAQLAIQCLPRLICGSLNSVAGRLDSCEERIKAQFHRLNELIHEESVLRPSLGRMGTTVVLAIFRHDQVTLAHLGDSRAYRWSQGVLHRLTEDHNVQSLLEREGQSTRACDSRRRLTRYLGMPESAWPDVITLAHSVDDVILLCTDGLAGPLSDDDIASLIVPEISLQATADQLVDQARRRGGTDDATVLLVAGTERIPSTKSIPT